MRTGALPVVLVAVLVVGGGVATALALRGSGQSGTRSREGVPALRHVVLIVGENTSYAQITRRSAPYLTGTLKPRAAWMTNYRSFPKSSSLGEYIAMVSGQYTNCEANNDTPDRCHQNVPNLFQQLDGAGRSWTDWEQSMGQPCDIVDHGAAWSRNIFSAHHNPAVYFTGIYGTKYDEAVAPKPECRTHDLPTGTTAPDDTSALDASLRAGRLSDFTLIIPDDCADGHDPCPTAAGNPVRQFDDFVAREVPRIESSPAWDKRRDMVAVTWDEGGDPPQDPAHPLLALSGGPVKPGTYEGRYDHYSLERTLADAFGVPPLANARRAKPLTRIWG